MTVQAESAKELIAEQAAQWFVENRNDALPVEQKQEFMRWLRMSPVHVAEYLLVVRTARAIGAVAAGSAIPLEQLLAQAAAQSRITSLRVGEDSPQSSPPKVPRFLRGAPRWSHSLGAIAAALALVTVGWLWVRYQTNADYYVTGYAEDRTVKLTDYTVVHLNSNSAVSVHFNKHRRWVEVVRGEALFDVARDITRPFQVRAGDTVIEDVGTVFDVLRQQHATVVTVLEGQVSLWGIEHRALEISGQSSSSRAAAAARPSRVSLDAGDQALISPSGAIDMRHPIDLRQATPWFRPQIVFERESIAAVAAEFNHHSPVRIEVMDPKIANMTVSGVFHSYDVTSFATFLNSLSGVQAQMIAGELQVSSTGAPGTSN